jgi:hypothetical protein
MGGGGGYTAEYGAADHGAAATAQLSEAIRLFEDAVWYLEAAASPDEILTNVCAVLSYAHALFGGEYHDQLGAEYEAWQQVAPHTVTLDVMFAARDHLVRDAWQLDGLARGWLEEVPPPDRAYTYQCLGVLSAGAAGAREMIYTPQ